MPSGWRRARLQCRLFGNKHDVPYRARVRASLKQAMAKLKAACGQGLLSEEGVLRRLARIRCAAGAPSRGDTLRRCNKIPEHQSRAGRWDRGVSFGSNRRKRFLDLFSGTGRVSGFARRLGAKSVCMDIKRRSSMDLASARFVKKLGKRIVRREFFAAMVALPCTTLSRARSPPLRSNAHLWGLPRLPDADRQQLRLANTLIKNTIKMIFKQTAQMRQDLDRLMLATKKRS